MQKPSSRRHLLLLALIACCLLFIVGYTGRLAEQARLEAAVTTWETRIAAAQMRQAELGAELAYVRSDAYVHKQARETLNLVLPGDQLVVVVDEPPTEPRVTVAHSIAPSITADRAAAPNWRQWLELFLPANNSRL